jgi:hypothetical protein
LQRFRDNPSDEEAKDNLEAASENLNAKLKSIAKTFGLSVFLTGGSAFIVYESYCIYLCSSGVTACTCVATGVLGTVASFAAGSALPFPCGFT